MSKRASVPLAVTHHIRDSCVCLQLQCAARSVARRFDDAFRDLGLTNGQFSLLMFLNRPGDPRLGEVAALLAMDRTTLTAALKPLLRRGLVRIMVDGDDRRSRILRLTQAGRKTLAAAVPVWRREHRKMERRLGAPAAFRTALRTLAGPHRRRQSSAR